MQLLNINQIYSGHIQRLRTVTGLLHYSHPRHTRQIYSDMQAEIAAPVQTHIHDSAQFHPIFSSPDGDVILGAKGGKILFRMHSFTLRTASGWFRAMLSLPQERPPVAADITYLDEETPILEGLFLMICGLPIVPPTDYDMVEALLYGAEKYDMPGPTSGNQQPYHNV